MSRDDKLLNKIRDPQKANNVTVDELCRAATLLGWQQHSKKGTSHVIFSHKSCPDIINFQKAKNGKAKTYQVKQLRNFMISIEISEARKVKK